MLISPAGLKVYVCTEPVDMRKSFYSLAGLTRDFLKEDPLSGAVFVFMNKRADYLKALYWSGDGFCLWSKRLEHGAFDRLRCTDVGGHKRTLSVAEFTLLTTGVKVSKINFGATHSKRKSAHLFPENHF